MLRITVELVQQGDENRKLHMATAEIVNDGTGNSDIGNYKIRLSKWGNPAQIWKCGELNGFPRKWLGPWDLLSLCLVATIGDRIKEFKESEKPSEPTD